MFFMYPNKTQMATNLMTLPAGDDNAATAANEVKVEQSPCGKYRVETMKDDSGAQMTMTFYFSNETRTVYNDKYILRKIIRNSDNQIIFQYRQYCGHAVDFHFFTQGTADWFLGSLEYMSQLFINLQTGQYYDNCQVKLKDNGYVRQTRNAKQDSNDGFIWVEPTISPDGKLALVHGCYWAYPMQLKVYDLSDIKNGWQFLSDIGEELYPIFVGTKILLYEQQIACQDQTSELASVVSSELLPQMIYEFDATARTLKCIFQQERSEPTDSLPELEPIA
jgi:hypothetical protein